MKIDVFVKKVAIYHGVVEMTNERFKFYKSMTDDDIIKAMMFNGLSKEEDWALELFEDSEKKK